MRRVLLICYDFPPAGGSGVQRPLKLARDLPEHGWQPTILCCGHHHHALHDSTLLDELPDSVRVERVNGWEPAGLVKSVFAAAMTRSAPTSRIRRLHEDIASRLVWRIDAVVDRCRLPERQWLWSMAATRAAQRILAREHFDAVITSGPPHSVHRVGLTLRRHCSAPWVAELRDPIVSNFAYHPPGPRADRFWRRLETEIVRSAARVIVTCDDLAADLAARHPDAADLLTRTTTITNGWDPSDFHATMGDPPDNDKLTIAYVGAFYQQQSIEPVLLAFRRLLDARPDVVGRVGLEHVGSLAAHQAQFLRPGDARFLVRTGYQPHGAALTRLHHASCVLLIVPANAGGRLCIPAKTFEYLASGRHVLGVVHADTSLAALLQRAGGCTLVHDFSPGALAAAIESVFERWAGGLLDSSRNASLLHETRRDVLAGRYANVLSGLLPPTRAAAPRNARADMPSFA